MVPAVCSLTDEDLGAQLERYRQVGASSAVCVHEPRRLVISVGDAVPERLVDELVSVERSCCPFFELSWSTATHELSFSVRAAEHEPALAAVARALVASGSAT